MIYGYEDFNNEKAAELNYNSELNPNMDKNNNFL
jgi:hypothetical protein